MEFEFMGGLVDGGNKLDKGVQHFRLRQQYHLSWTKTWEIVKFYAPIALKLLCLERSGLAVPGII
jgi:hypothetical protein